MLKKILFSVALLGFLILAALPLWAPSLGTFLVYETPLEKADLIHVFSGGPFERSAHAAALYQLGWSEKILVTGGYIPQVSLSLGLGMHAAEIGARTLTRMGVPYEAITIEPVGRSTFDELADLLDLADREGLRSIILVSSEYHMRRIYRTSRLLFGDRPVRLIFSPAETPWYDGRRWWDNELSFLAVFNEYLKHLYYFFSYAL